MTTKKRRRKKKPPVFKTVRVINNKIVEPVLYYSKTHGVYTAGIVDGKLYLDDQSIPLAFTDIGEEEVRENPIVGKYKPIRYSDPIDDLL